VWRVENNDEIVERIWDKRRIRFDLSIGQLQSWKEAVQEWLNSELKILCSGKIKKPVDHRNKCIKKQSDVTPGPLEYENGILQTGRRAR
jgi:hypothetical protein